MASRTGSHRLLEMLNWETARGLSSLSLVHRSLVTAVAALRRLDYPWDAELMAPYGQLMHEVARKDLDFMESHGSEAEKVEMAVAAAVLFQPVLRALHRLAQEEESARRYGTE